MLRKFMGGVRVLLDSSPGDRAVFPGTGGDIARSDGMRAIVSAITLLAAALSAASPATAAGASWSPPAPIPGAPAAFPSPPSAPGGPRAVYWSPLEATPATSVSLLGAGLVPGPARPLAAPFRLAPDSIGSDLPVVDARGRATLPALAGAA